MIAGIERFKRPRAFCQLFWADARLSQQWRKERSIGRITKAGSSMARWVLGRASKHILRTDPAMRAWFKKLKQQYVDSSGEVDLSRISAPSRKPDVALIRAPRVARKSQYYLSVCRWTPFRYINFKRLASRIRAWLGGQSRFCRATTRICIAIMTSIAYVAVSMAKYHPHVSKNSPSDRTTNRQ